METKMIITINNDNYDQRKEKINITVETEKGKEEYKELNCKMGLHQAIGTAIKKYNSENKVDEEIIGKKASII